MVLTTSSPRRGLPEFLEWGPCKKPGRFSRFFFKRVTGPGAPSEGSECTGSPGFLSLTFLSLLPLCSSKGIAKWVRLRLPVRDARVGVGRRVRRRCPRRECGRRAADRPSRYVALSLSSALLSLLTLLVSPGMSPRLSPTRTCADEFAAMACAAAVKEGRAVVEALDESGAEAAEKEILKKCPPTALKAFHGQCKVPVPKRLTDCECKRAWLRHYWQWIATEKGESSGIHGPLGRSRPSAVPRVPVPVSVCVSPHRLSPPPSVPPVHVLQ